MNRSAVFVLLCAYLAFAASDIVSRTVFERLPHLEDEIAYLFQARIYERGQADFADCLIERTASAAGCSRTMTFDRSAVKGCGMALIE